MLFVLIYNKLQSNSRQHTWLFSGCVSFFFDKKANLVFYCNSKNHYLFNGSLYHLFISADPPLGWAAFARLAVPELVEGPSEAEAQEANLDTTQLRASAKAAPAQGNKGGA